MKTLVAILITITTLFQSFNNETSLKHIALLDQVFETLEKEIANPQWLEEKSFLAFKNKMYTKEVLMLKDDDFCKVFNKGCKKLAFSHFVLIKKNNDKTKTKSNTKQKVKSLLWEPINKKTAYLQIKTFNISGEPMVKILQEIGTDNYENLIIDIRGNGGGSLDAPVILGQFLTQKPIDAGYYLTRKWFETNESLPTQEMVNKMPFLQDFTYSGITKMFANESSFRTVIPGHKRPIFKGTTYVLIDNNTASACEPFIYLLQNKKIATLVGETSNGAMLSGTYFTINKDFEMFLPIADYYTAESIKIDKIGVKPDIETISIDAKEYVLKLIE